METARAGLSGFRQAKAITLTPDSLNRFQRLLRVQLLPQSSYKDFQHITIPLIVLRVQMLSQFSFRNYLAWMEHKILKHFVLIGREINAFFINGQPLCGDVEAKGAKLQLGLSESGGTAQQRVKTCLNLSSRNGFTT
jgi:hypothetical protein